MEVAEFAEIADEFTRRVRRTIWATVTTVDGHDRPRSRILHPVWEGPVGWVATGRHTHKARHLERNPFVSVTYWDPDHEQVVVECRATWVDDPDEKARVWRLISDTPAPVGYDLRPFWPEGPGSSEYGALRLDPWRLELWSMADLVGGVAPLVWRPR